eukprot:gene16928-biopygen9796
MAGGHRPREGRLCRRRRPPLRLRGAKAVSTSVRRGASKLARSRLSRNVSGSYIRPWCRIKARASVVIYSGRKCNRDYYGDHYGSTTESLPLHCVRSFRVREAIVEEARAAHPPADPVAKHLRGRVLGEGRKRIHFTWVRPWSGAWPVAAAERETEVRRQRPPTIQVNAQDRTAPAEIGIDRVLRAPDVIRIGLPAVAPRDPWKFLNDNQVRFPSRVIAEVVDSVTKFAMSGWAREDTPSGEMYPEPPWYCSD